MSWAFSKSMPDNQEGLGFSLLYPWRSPFELFHSMLDIPVPDHITFWTDGCFTRLQIKRNLKVGKKRLEDCMLKRAGPELREICLQTHIQCLDRAIDYFPQIAMYQHTFPLCSSSDGCGTTEVKSWGVTTEISHPILTQLGRDTVVIPLSPYLLPDTKERKK